MSIKKLFGAPGKSKQYVSDKNTKDAFEGVESERNVRAIRTKQEHYIPPVDYADPITFARYGSAYLYYESAIDRLINFYPYDGSDAELNEFYNKSLEIEKYIFDNVYPRLNGYGANAPDGWGDAQTAPIGANFFYGLPENEQFIEFKGGPHTASSTTLAGMSPNPYNSNFRVSNIYDTGIYQTEGLPSNYGQGTRESNLKCNFDTGVTIEFWLTTGSAGDLATLNALTQKQVVVDIWNTNGVASPPTADNHDYGRITIELNGTASVDGGVGYSPFLLTAQSGPTTGIFQETIGTHFISDGVSGSFVDVDTLATWHHYAFTIYNSGSDLATELYVDGHFCSASVFTGQALGELPSKNMMGRIGALTRAPVGTGAVTGSGKLSGSMDEFRFWKERRNGQDIGRHWFTQVRGGTNSDISNTTLGIYYKFNEGETGVSNTDSYVLDYSGRISNGMWNNYTSSAGMRITSSAMVIASASIAEYKDPIIRSSNPAVTRVKNSLLASGSYHDANNNTSFLSLLPSWVIEEHENERNERNDLTMISHIAGAYLDTLFLQIDSLTKLKNPTYTSSSYKPIPFAQHLPQSLGLYTPDLFVDASLLERFLNRKEDSKFENDLFDAKNLIYLNLYKNLAHIYKAKGTEKAIRNVFRCFNIDESLMRLNVYAGGSTYELQNNLQQTLVNKTSLNFNASDSTGSIVFQRTNPLNGESSGYIAGSMVGGTIGALHPDPITMTPTSEGVEDNYGFTAEVDVTFPEINAYRDKFTRGYGEVSLFGIVSASSERTINDPDYTTWLPNDSSNFKVGIVKDPENPRNAYFRVTSSLGSTPFPLLTSSYIPELYDNQRWTLSVRLKPPHYPLTSFVTGVMSNLNSDYTLIFEGLNSEIGVVSQKFHLTASIPIDSSVGFLRASKRLWTGAYRTNLTGTLLEPCDVYVGGARYWTKYLEQVSLEQHMLDINNHGISGSYRNISSISPVANASNDATQGEMLNLYTLALDWNFDNVTGSDDAGNFVVTDISSGSTEIRDHRSWLGKISGYQHSGYGYDFPVSSPTVVSREATNTYKFTDPEIAISSDMIQILDSDDKVFGSQELLQRTLPNYFYVLEKSMYAAISEEMLTFFAGVVDFNNLIGDPVNRYRGRYKSIEKLREIFFRKVTKVSDVEKYIDYYKWFDDALSDIIEQLVPASVDFLPDVTNTVESHVLERHKYESKFPTLEFKQPDLQAALHGLDLRLQAYDTAHGSPTYKHKLFWKRKANAAAEEITSGDATVDTQRNNIKKVGYSHPLLSQSVPTLFTVDGAPYQRNTFARRNFQNIAQMRTYDPLGTGSVTIQGGVNFRQNKNILFTYNALYPAGPVNKEGGVFIPRNVLLADVADIVPVDEAVDYTTPVGAKVKRYFKLQHGRDWEDGLGYSNVKSSFAWPFNVVSSSVTTGYNAIVAELASGNFANVEITNLHNDVYNHNWEIPIQSPFTDYAVGGHQSRHIALNSVGKRAVGAINLVLNPSEGDTITLAGTIFTFTNHPSLPTDVDIDSGAKSTATGFVVKINSYFGGLITANNKPDPPVEEPLITLESSPGRHANSSITYTESVVGTFSTTGMEGGTKGPRGLDDYLSRPEAWKLLLGYCDKPTGAIGMVGPDYPWPEANEVGETPYPMTGAQKAVFYRDEIAKRPVNIRNILLRTGSTILGNYSQNYQVVHTVGAYSNPRHFIKYQPKLPGIITASIGEITPSIRLGATTQIDNFLNLHRGEAEHYAYPLTASGPIADTGSANKSVIRSTFAAPGGPEVQTRGFQDFRSGEYSVYNSINNKNLSVIKPTQQANVSMSAYPASDGIPGIRAYDIHGLDYGLRPQLVRHTARFGRDSLWISGTTSVIDGPLSTAGGPGASSYQRPGFHKVHRNNICVIACEEAVSGTSVPGQSNLDALKWPQASSNDGAGLYLQGNTVNENYLWDGNTADSKWTVSLWINAGLHNPTTNPSTILSLGYDEHTDSPLLIYTDTFDADGQAARINIKIPQNNGNSNSPRLAHWRTDEILSPAGWNHLAVSYSTASTGLVGTTDPTVYLNGTVQQLTTVTTPKINLAVLTGAVNFRQISQQAGDIDGPIMLGGFALSPTVGLFTGSLDEVSFFDDALASGNIESIYNNGKPTDITASSYTNSANSPAVANVIGWWRMGDGQALLARPADSGSLNGTGNNGKIVSYNQIIAESNQAGGNNALMLVVNSGNDTGINTHQGNDVPDNPREEIWSDSDTCAMGAQYDNFYVQHQIPRASKQYRWIGTSLVDSGNIRYCRFGVLRGPQAGLYSSSVGGWDSFFDFVSASEFGSYMWHNQRLWGARANSPASELANLTEDPIRFIPTVRHLNLNIYEPISASINTIGYQLGEVTQRFTPPGPTMAVPLYASPPSPYVHHNMYLNKHGGLIDGVWNAGVGGGAGGASANAFNALMFKREGPFGWPTWRQIRHANNPIIRDEVKNNVVSVVTSAANQIDTFRLPPVSMRGRTAMASFKSDGGNLTLRMTNNNERIFFNETRMNNLANIQYNEIVTPFDQAVMLGTVGLNWVAYTENVFPSSRNAFVSHSTNRSGYSIALGGEPWRTKESERYDIGSTLGNSWGLHLSQSCHVLDAPVDFLYRTEPPALTYRALYGQYGLALAQPLSIIHSSQSAGELQATYTSFVTAAADCLLPGGVSGLSILRLNANRKIEFFTNGALYSYKHMLDTPHSVGHRTGIPIAQTGNVDFYRAFGMGTFNASTQLWNQNYGWASQSFNGAYAGEALWEAPVLAGIVRKSGSTYVFESHPSEPWFDTYEDFRYELKLVAKDYAIIPEFRISEHLEDYLDNGIADRSKFDTFEIPGTDITSATSSFYVDYSNSEFMNEFLKVKSNTGLGAKEIKLICSAAIRFHPYKSFYPAQRTLDMASQFHKSYKGGFNAHYGLNVDGPFAKTLIAGPTLWVSGGARIAVASSSVSFTQTDIRDAMTTGSMRPLIQPLFAPGILYNSIKSGIAVDWPVVTDPRKRGFARFGGVQSSSVAMAIGAADTNNWAICTINTAAVPPRTAYSNRANYEPFLGNHNITTGEEYTCPTNTGSAYPGQYCSGEFWDKRLPFETIVNPEKYIKGMDFFDMDPHPSASFSNSGPSNSFANPSGGDGTLTASCTFEDTDPLYTMLASNFCGTVPKFFLKDGEFTTLTSEVIPDNLRFKTGSIYGARLRLRRSMKGPRVYLADSGSQGGAGFDYGFTTFGARAYSGSGFQEPNSIGHGDWLNPEKIGYISGSFPIPQDPKQTFYQYKETFTMYSRPSAFGPPIASRRMDGNGQPKDYENALGRRGIMDSFNGFNPSFTPPYYDGEAWCDLLFKPRGDKAYSLEDILAEIETVYWRFDAGPKIPVTWLTRGVPASYPYDRSLISNNSGTFIYGGDNINANSMQLSASFNLFGIERVLKQEKDKFGELRTIKNEFAGSRWVIQPKFETPMLNFNDEGIRPIISRTTPNFPGQWLTPAQGSTLTLPTNYGSASVPRGLWHQFGVIPSNKKTGVFLDIGDIPTQWLKYHYEVINPCFAPQNFQQALDDKVQPMPNQIIGLSGSGFTPYNDYLQGNIVWTFQVSGAIRGHGLDPVPGTSPAIPEAALAKRNNPALSRSQYLWEIAARDCHKNMKSLVDLFGFKKKQIRLGELAEKQRISEAVVMVPYVVDSISDPKNKRNIFRKKFINIPKQRYDAALNKAKGSRKGDTLDTAGASIRKLTQKMKRYILPPQFDFLRNKDIDPIVMYMFEFHYDLDRDDLSYIWQNLAPRNHKKISLDSRSVTHDLMNLELLNEDNLLKNQNLRWMVFKVKQRAMHDYDDQIVPQVGTAAPRLFDAMKEIIEENSYKLGYNWPYDYISFVESVKIDTQVLYNDEVEGQKFIKVPIEPGTEEIQVVKKKIIVNPNPVIAGLIKKG